MTAMGHGTGSPEGLQPVDLHALGAHFPDKPRDRDAATLQLAAAPADAAEAAALPALCRVVTRLVEENDALRADLARLGAILQAVQGTVATPLATPSAGALASPGHWPIDVSQSPKAIPLDVSSSSADSLAPTAMTAAHQAEVICSVPFIETPPASPPRPHSSRSATPRATVLTPTPGGGSQPLLATSSPASARSDILDREAVMEATRQSGARSPDAGNAQTCIWWTRTPTGAPVLFQIRQPLQRGDRCSPTKSRASSPPRPRCSSPPGAPLSPLPRARSPTPRSVSPTPSGESHPSLSRLSNQSRLSGQSRLSFKDTPPAPHTDPAPKPKLTSRRQLSPQLGTVPRTLAHASPGQRTTPRYSDAAAGRRVSRALRFPAGEAPRPRGRTPSPQGLPRTPSPIPTVAKAASGGGLTDRDAVHRQGQLSLHNLKPIQSGSLGSGRRSKTSAQDRF